VKFSVLGPSCSLCAFLIDSFACFSSGKESLKNIQNYIIGIIPDKMIFGSPEIYVSSVYRTRRKKGSFLPLEKKTNGRDRMDANSKRKEEKV